MVNLFKHNTETLQKQVLCIVKYNYNLSQKYLQQKSYTGCTLKVISDPHVHKVQCSTINL